MEKTIEGIEIQTRFYVVSNATVSETIF